MAFPIGIQKVNLPSEVSTIQVVVSFVTEVVLSKVLT